MDCRKQSGSFETSEDALPEMQEEKMVVWPGETDGGDGEKEPVCSKKP